MAEQGTVEVEGQLVAYEWLEIDLRAEGRRGAESAIGLRTGDPAVVIPGHGQTVASPAKLAAAAAALSAASLAWCIRIFTPEGGDPVKARALSLIVRERIAARFPTPDGPAARPAPPPQATLMGWSHGGAEALRAADLDPALFPRVAGLCATGLIERRPQEFIPSFLLEATRIVWNALLRRDRAAVRDGLRVGFDIARGIVRDLACGRSLSRVLDDIRWASRKVSGPGFGYSGNVALLFARNDTVIRWEAVFPDCGTPEEISSHLGAYCRADFPNATQLRVAVLDGDHLSPENAAEAYARMAFDLLGE